MVDKTLDQDGVVQRRRQLAQEIVDNFHDITDEERQAFFEYCEQQEIGKKRLKRSLFESFLANYRKRKLEDSRRQQALIFVQKYQHQLELKNLNTTESAFLMSKTVDVCHPGLALQLSSKFLRLFTDAEITEALINEAESAQVFIDQLAFELAEKVNHELNAGRQRLIELADRVVNPDVFSWIGGEDLAKQTYLTFPEKISAEEVILLAKRRLGALQAEVSRAKRDVLKQKIILVPDAKIDGKSLACRYRHNFTFLSSQMAIDLTVVKALEDTSVDILARAISSDLKAAIDKVLELPRQSLVARLHDQIKRLEKRLRILPHIDLLTDIEIIKTVSLYYSGVDMALKKRRARDALVAVEERAREAKYHEDVKRLTEHQDAYADVARYYPLARSLRRELVLFVGPTNSGKTWRALNELAAGESGAYLAPLRLLALEGQEELEKRGKIASFLTGEERELKPGATFVSSTIEMLNPDKQVDAVVVDEVQLLADERRGWAWLAAVVGAPAKKVIMTGSPDCVEIVKALAAYLDEDLVIHECHRYNELRVAEHAMRLRDITPGTAIVCFSRRDVLRIKDTIESNSSLKVSVVYGNLSPQVRREEARRFREGEAEILIATDAIAMGLNLPIKQVVFYAVEKFDGESVRELTPSEIRQIAGRAGRYGFAQFGVANALTEHGLEMIRSAIKMPMPSLTPPFYVAPGHNHVRIIGKVLDSDSLERILTFFEKAIEFSDERFTRSNIDELSFLSSFVDAELGHLPLEDRLTIASAPVDIKSEVVMGWFIERMLPVFKASEAFENDTLNDLFEQAENFSGEVAFSTEQLREAEDYLKALTVYAWLAYRYGDVFTELEECETRREQVNAFIERTLRRQVIKRCAACGAKLAKDYPYRKCDRCHMQARPPKGKVGQRQAENGGKRGRRAK